MKRSILSLGLSALLLATTNMACKKSEAPAAMPTPDNAVHVYTGHGVIQLFQEDGRIVVLKHEAIVGFMDAMTMGFELQDPASAKRLKVGDTVDFTLQVKGYDVLITKIAKAVK